MENKNLKIVIIAAVIIFFLMLVGINVYLSYDSGNVPVADQTYADYQDPVTPAVITENGTGQILPSSEETVTDTEESEEEEPAEADPSESPSEDVTEEESPEPEESVTPDPVEPAASVEPVTASPEAIDPLAENTTPPEEVIVPEVAEPVVAPPAPVVTPVYVFRNQKLLNEHYEKHGIEMGFTSAEAYQAAASAVITNPNSLFKIEAEDGDGVYYLEATNEFVVLSTDGYIRTYFLPSSGKAYFDRQ
ncbi:MAG: hypothetical protein J6X94_11915 [Lachnospiraceae bacterium]|nr:hypothetical protein [Lachnospiraceae bacterium]